MKTRKNRPVKSSPLEDPSLYKDETIRKAKDGYWWVVENGVWKLLRPPKKRKHKSRRIKEWEKTIGVILVSYNLADKCILKSSNQECIIKDPPTTTTWTFSDILTPSSPKEIYASKDKYTGDLNEMKEFNRQLESQFSSLKRLGMLRNYKIIAVPYTERHKLDI
jgi:hypothetical protein